MSKYTGSLAPADFSGAFFTCVDFQKIAKNPDYAIFTTEVHFDSFLSCGFITAIVVNPPESKLAKHTFVHCTVLETPKNFNLL